MGDHKKFTSVTATGSPAQVASSDTVVTLMAANTDRVGLLVHNDSTAVLYLKFGSGASATDYTVRMVSQAYYECPYPVYRGVVTGIWASANGNAYVTELV